MTVELYDTTLRDGAQTEGISFSVEDKLKIAKKLDELGVHYIEGGWPGASPTDTEFFTKIKKLELKKSKISAFCSTRRKDSVAADDVSLKAIVSLKPDLVCIFGKSWDFHVTDALRTTLDENLNMIYDSVTFLKKSGFKVFYDAEHFFDGFKANRDYAVKTLQAAERAGADCLVLCDTNGGTLPDEVFDVLNYIKKFIKIPLGIHTHNDSGMADANSLVAVKADVKIVQGTINGYGERCGNANLCVIIPNLYLKQDLVKDINLSLLVETSRFVSEIANMVPNDKQPYVGFSAFAHKAGVHASAIERNTKTYEHISPELVGNRRRILISELSGKSNVLTKARELGIKINEDKIKDILTVIKEKEKEGYQFEGADASFELLIKKSIGEYKPVFNLQGFKVVVEKDAVGKISTQATIKIEVQNVHEQTTAKGDGPVNSLDNALRGALEKFYPGLRDVSLTDFKVRVINAKTGTAAKVKVLIESQDHNEEWGSVGVSENVIEASWQALVDSIEYKLLKQKS